MQKKLSGNGLVLGYALAMACICTRIGFAPHIRSQQDDSR